MELVWESLDLFLDGVFGRCFELVLAEVLELFSEEYLFEETAGNCLEAVWKRFGIACWKNFWACFERCV